MARDESGIEAAWVVAVRDAAEWAARDTEHNEAVVLAEVLRRGLPRAEAG
jgi:hypothetical protein